MHLDLHVRALCAAFSVTLRMRADVWRISWRSSLDALDRDSLGNTWVHVLVNVPSKEQQKGESMYSIAFGKLVPHAEGFLDNSAYHRL